MPQDAVRAAPGGGAPGADAVTPGRIPLRGWWYILRRVGQRLDRDKLPLLSAGIAFFAVLSIAPVLVTALAVYGAVNSPEEALEQLSGMAEMLPPQVRDIMADQLISITTASAQVHTVSGVIALVVALSTATTAAAYLVDALTVAYHEQETRGLLHRTALAAGFVLGGALLLGGVLAAAGVAGPVLAGAPGFVRAGAQVLAWAVLALLMAVTLELLYRFGPDRRRRAQLRWTSWGAVASTSVWLVTSLALFEYVRRLGTYERTYGSLAGVAISMLWLWITVLLIVVGAAVNAEAERQTARDSTVGPERPLGSRGAVVADSAPPYQGEE